MGRSVNELTRAWMSRGTDTSEFHGVGIADAVRRLAFELCRDLWNDDTLQSERNALARSVAELEHIVERFVHAYERALEDESQARQPRQRPWDPGAQGGGQLAATKPLCPAELAVGSPIELQTENGAGEFAANDQGEVGGEFHQRVAALANAIASRGRHGREQRPAATEDEAHQQQAYDEAAQGPAAGVDLRALD